MCQLFSHSEADTMKIGEILGKCCRGGELIALCGDLGAGKTLITRGFGNGLGVKAAIHSPTFSLVNEYAGRLWLYHSDFYRLNHVDEVMDLGIEEYLNPQGVLVIEWADKYEAVLPRPFLKINLAAISEDQREISIQSVGSPIDNFSVGLEILKRDYSRK